VAQSVEQPGQRYSCAATKEARHKSPAVELFHPGIALKSENPDPMVPNAANAALAETIAVGEEMVIALTGVWPVAIDDLPGGAVVGDPLYITRADNVLVNAATALTGGVIEAPYVKFGRISAIDATLDEALVNLNLRDTF
jgi:hypothetical protein